MTDTPAPPRSSPLHDRHEGLGASFTDFGGWNMPVRYSSDLAEHRAVREAAGLFDISHMAEFWVHDGEAAEFLDYVLAGRVSAMKLGKAKYSLALAESGGIVDDVIVYRTGEKYYLVIANASNRDAVAAAFARARDTWTGGELPEVDDVTDHVALVALQGPRARGILESVPAIEILSTPLDELGYYAFTEGTFDGDSLFIARTGYTGEDGYELLVPVERAGDLWDALLDAGTPAGLVPCGLAARSEEHTSELQAH